MTHSVRLLARLSDGLWHSHHELYELRVMVHSRVADLRRKGYVIECDKTSRPYKYRLLSKPSSEPGGGLPNTERSKPRVLVAAAAQPCSPLEPDPSEPGSTCLEAAAATNTQPTLFDLAERPAWH